MNNEPERDRKADGKSLRWAGMGPVVLSAVVFPGVGQLIQRRWVAGVGYAVTFAVAFSWLLVRFFGVLATYYRLAFDFEVDPGVAPSLGLIVRPFVVALVLYLASLIDTALGNRLQGPHARQPTSPP